MLVNNAGLVRAWDWKVWDVLANGVVRGTDLALARMKPGGIVVQVADTVNSVSLQTATEIF